jgi:predicted PurR-regulated permease PerM
MRPQRHGRCALSEPTGSTSRGSGPRPVPSAVRTAAAWSWRVLLIGLLAYVLLQVAVRLGSLVLTLLAALLLTALLRPVVDWLDRRGLPRLVATWLALLTLIAFLAAVFVLAQQRASTQLTLLRGNLAGGLRRLRDVAVEQVGIPPERVDGLVDALVDQVLGGTSSAGTASAVVSGVTTAATVLAAVALALFTAFFLVYDGERVWRFAVRLFPMTHRSVADQAGQRAWQALGGYLRGTTVIALIDAAGIGLALLLIGVPLPFTLALLTFLGGYIPLVGATVAGLAAVLVAFAANGATDALLTLGAVFLVQQLEGQLLQPIVMGRAVQLHPLGIAWALAVGGLLYGLAGAVVAVPVAAAGYAVGAYLAGPEPSALGAPSRRS